jgi:hypothetical protein
MHQGKNDMGNPYTSNVAESEDNFDLLDFALTIAENIWLLVLGPLAVGAVVYGLTSLLPATYESVAILQPVPAVSIPVRKDEVAPNPTALANTAATKMTTATVLDSALQKLGGSGGATPQDNHKLQASIRAAVGRNDNLVTLVVSSTSPVASQRLATAVLEIAYAESRPKATDLNRLTTEKGLIEQQLKEQLKAQKITGEKIQALIARSDTTPELGDLAKTHAFIASNLVEMQHRLKGIDTQLGGITEEALVQQPTLPTAPVSPRKKTIALLSAVGTGFLLLIGVFIQRAWRISNASLQNKTRIDALKRKYGLLR